MVGHNSEMAEELTQQVFARMVEKISTFKGTGSIKSWLLTISVNIVRDNFKKNKKEVSLSATGRSTTHNIRIMESIPDSSGEPIKDVELQETKKQVAEALKKLPEEQKEIVILKHYHGLKLEEISSMLDISVNTVKSRLRYGLLKLYDDLKQLEYE